MTNAAYSNGQNLQYIYDASGRLATTRETGSIQDVTYRYVYDSTGRLGYLEKIKATTSSLRIRNTYNSSNLLESQRVEMSGDTYTKQYTYNPDNTLASMVTGAGANTGTPQAITLEYDALRRVNKVDAQLYDIDYTYVENTAGGETTLVGSKSYSGISNRTFGYTYDGRGYISSYTDSATPNIILEYEYDSKGQLTRVTKDNKATLLYSYTYDNAGNLLTANNYTNNHTYTHTYTYGNSGWGDLLTAYDGQPIAYDGVGNPTSYYNGSWYNFTWENGRTLKNVSVNGTEVTFLEDIDGCRTRKTANGVVHNYLHQDGKVIKERFYKTDMFFYYDQDGAPYAMRINNILYYYITNLQGDVVALVDGSGTTAATYEYDPYGKILSSSGIDVLVTVSNTQTTTGRLDLINPLRYRGYYYDQETGLYYLLSRYYDPNTGRFINADGYTATGQGLLGNNMFAYCLNNPVCLVDTNGEMAGTAAVLATNFWNPIGWTAAAILAVEIVAIVVSAVIIDEIQDYPTVVFESEHTKNKRPSTKGKHEKGQTRKNRDQGGEKKEHKKGWVPNRNKRKTPFQ